MSSAYLSDVVERYHKHKESYPVEVLTVVAVRCGISIGSKGWEAKATRKLNRAIDQQLGVTTS